MGLLKKIVRILFTCIFAIVAIGVQLGFYFLIFFSAFKFPLASIALEIVALVVVLLIYRRDMNASFKLSWTIVILVLPVAGILLYLLFGNGRTLPKHKARKVRAYLEQYETESNIDIVKNDPVATKLANIVHYGSNLPIYQDQYVNFFSDAIDKHEDLLENLKKAQKYIYIEYFIIADGYVLESIFDILRQKGEEGIEIKVLYDDIGCKLKLKRKTINRLKTIPNIQIHAYQPLGVNINPTQNFRDHRKIVIIDGVIGYVGGDNLADEYIHKKEKYGYWRDNAVRIEGESVNNLLVLFTQIWYMSCREMIDIDSHKYNVQSSGICNLDGSKNGYVMPFGDGPTMLKNPAYHLFEAMSNNAQKYLYISTPYFIIDNEFINMIKNAVECGIDVKILVPGIPDKPLIYRMTRGHYGDILKAGGKIYEYSAGFNHAKNVIVDDKYAFVGTVNCDYRSMYLHFECGALMIDNSEIIKMRNDFLSCVSSSREVTYEKWKKRSLFTKIIEVILNIFVPLL